MMQQRVQRLEGILIQRAGGDPRKRLSGWERREIDRSYLQEVENRILAVLQGLGVAFADVMVTAQGKLCLTADGTSAESVFYEVVDTLASLLQPGGARQSWCWAKSLSVSRRTGGPQNAERLEHTLGLAEGSARLCHNPVFGAF